MALFSQLNFTVYMQCQAPIMVPTRFRAIRTTNNIIPRALSHHYIWMFSSCPAALQLSACAELPLNESLSEAETKAKKYYISCLDVNQTIQSLGARPLLDLLHDSFIGWSVNWDLKADVWDFQDTLEKIHFRGMFGFFSFGVAEDRKEPTKNILQVIFKHFEILTADGCEGSTCVIILNFIQMDPDIVEFCGSVVFNTSSGFHL